MMGEAVPTINVAPFFAGDAAARAAVVQQMARAAEEIGFFAVTGHGVPEATVDRLYAKAREFFVLPQEEKARVAPPAKAWPRGYKAVGFESLAAGNAASAPTDLKEYYHFGREPLPDQPYYTGPEGRKFFYPNVWPARPAGFGAAAGEYYRAMEALAGRLLRIAALALELPEDFFDSRIDRHITATRINYYPPQENPPEAGQLRAGAHTDYGLLTILSGENAPGGLQVQTRAGAWLDVPTDPHRFVCNIGDLLMRWTNDRWVSNLHRVLNPPREIARAASRISIGFFHHPNYDALVECIPSCCRDRPAKYPPVLSGEFRDDKYAATRDNQTGGQKAA